MTFHKTVKKDTTKGHVMIDVPFQDLLRWCEALEAWGFNTHAHYDDHGFIITVRKWTRSDEAYVDWKTAQADRALHRLFGEKPR